MRARVLILVALLAAQAHAKPIKELAAEEGGPEEAAEEAAEEAGKLVLACNSTSSCKPCGAFRLNEYCRAAGGYAIASCVVARQGSEPPHEFVRPIKKKHRAAVEGSVETHHHGCMPQTRLPASRFMLLCALGAAASLAVVRLRARQLRRLSI